jgi:hypothetical protein
LSSFAVSPCSYEFGYVTVFGLSDWFTFNVDCSYRADFGAFAAAGATASFGPWLVKVHYDFGVFAAQFKV